MIYGLGTSKAGLSKFNGKEFVNYNPSNGFSSRNITDIFQDKTNDLWITTNGERGVCKYNYDTFTFYSEKEGLANNIVWSVIEGKKGAKWFATHNGLSYFNGKTFKNYTVEDGLEDNSISSIIEDENRNLWVSTVKSLHCLVYDEDNIHISKFSRNDGLKSVNFHAYSIELDHNNHLWLGNTSSVASLNLNTYNLQAVTPNIQLNTILINEQFIDYNALEASRGADLSNSLNLIKKGAMEVSDFNNYPENLKLPYNLNHLNFRFSAIDWSAPHNIEYSYKVEGLDKSWSFNTTNNYADYRNIPPGDYIFLVKAQGKSGTWSKPLQYQFSITPPWWLSVWAISGYVLFGVLCIVFGFKWYAYRFKKQQLILEGIVEKRTKTIIEQKEALSKANKDLEIERNKMELKALLNQINPHFIFNTLNSIQQFIIANNIKTSLDYFNKFGKLIRFSLEHSEKKFVSINDEINVLKNYVELENLRFSHPVIMKFSTAEIDIFNVQIPPMFIQPIIENAIIHGFSKKEEDKLIEVLFEEFDRYILCSVTDNGIGIKHSKSSKNKNSGLVITQKRLESVWGIDNISKAKIFIGNSKHKKSTIVKIKLPKRF